jgi:predicted RNase H-like HicB family nuclease
MLTEYVQNKMGRAKYEIMEDRTYFGALPGLRGVWANAKTLEGCRKELREVLEEWLLLKISSREKVPGLRWKMDQRKLKKSA